MAELICATVTPGLRVWQIVLRVWTVAPAFDQLMARLGLRIPDHAWPYKKFEQQSKMTVNTTNCTRFIFHTSRIKKIKLGVFNPISRLCMVIVNHIVRLQVSTIA
jgi:hypothetical protein